MWQFKRQIHRITISNYISNTFNITRVFINLNKTMIFIYITKFIFLIIG